MQFIVVPQHSERRIAVEQMVSAVFLDEYGAMISRFPDIMVAVLDDSDHPVCAASLRNHAGGLFSEQYLDEPFEAAIATARDRKSVVYGKSVSVRVDLGGRRIIKKKTKKTHNKQQKK